MALYIKLEDQAELNTILAALRVYQQAGMGDPINRDDIIQAIATNEGEDTSLDDAGIDVLCERINTKNHDEPRALALLRTVATVFNECDPSTAAEERDLITEMGEVAQDIEVHLGRTSGDEPGPSIDDAYNDAGILLNTLEDVNKTATAVQSIILIEFIKEAANLLEGIAVLGHSITADSTPAPKATA